MAQYYTDFSEYTTSQQPSDWTLQFGSRTWSVESVSGATGGQVLRATNTPDRDFLTWDEIDSDANRDDSEVLTRFRFPATDGVEIRALHRGSGSSGSETGYLLGARPDTGGWNYSYLDAGTFNDISFDNVDFDVDTWYWSRTQVIGTAVRHRYWQEGESEPGTWNLDITDSTISGVGWIGFYSGRDAQVDIDVFSVGTGTDPAPSSDPGGGDSVGLGNMTLLGVGA